MRLHFSRLTVNAGGDPNRPRPGRMWISNPYRVHQRVCMAFPHAAAPEAQAPRGPRHSVLFRIEDGPILRVLVQSSAPPQWMAAFENADFLLAASPETNSIDADFEPGDRFRFMLRANPTVKRKRPGKANGARVPLVDTEAQQAWLRRKADAGGFAPDWETLRIAPRGGQVSRRSRMKDKNPHTHYMVDYAGVLSVREPAAFKHALLAGVGPAKAYGCGLLSLARA